ncbi:MAG TPA: hypothetical protein VMM84_02560 [Pyrinomonadaceae bacterium]|nr:hypothetical protein [Pyrinomonadaceae bacterium]
MHLLLISAKRACGRLAPLLFLFLVVSPTLAQSLDITTPSPVRTNDLVGEIAVRDIGDSRLTNHYYAFEARPGDLTITVESRNLNGDIDVFTAGGLRPLLKFTVYAEVPTSITKTVFLRRREELILRVQARSPNDDEGIYHVRFGSTFEPAPGALLAEADPAETEKSQIAEGRGKRVSSVGARIEEPPPPAEEVATATPEPTPSEEATPEPTPSEVVTSPPEATPADSPAPEVPVETAEPRPGRAARTPRGRRAATRRGTEPTPRASEKAAEIVKEETKVAEETKGEAEVAGVSKTEEKPVEDVEPATTPPARGVARRRTPRQPPPPPEPEPEIGPRLIIETRAGERIERFMSTIRRVTIERNQIVVVGRDGKIERTLLSDVIRMSIEP